MDNFDFSCNIVREKYDMRMGYCLSIALIGWIISAYIYLYNAANVTAPYVLGGTIILTFYGIIIRFIKQFKLNISASDDKIVVHVPDPELGAPLFVESPLIIHIQWHYQETGKARVVVKKMYVTFCDGRDQPIVTFIAMLGKLRATPSNAEYIDIKDKNSCNRLKVAEIAYATSKTIVIAEKLNNYINVKEKHSI